MCMEIAMAILSAGQQVLSIQSQNEMAVQQANMARTAAISEYQQLEEQARQISIQGAGENLERTRQALRERARLRVAIGEAGVAGNSPLREIANSFLQESNDKGIINVNTQNRLNQNRLEANAAFINQQYRINQAKSMVVDPIQALLGITAAGLSGFNQGKSMGESFSGGRKTLNIQPTGEYRPSSTHGYDTGRRAA